MSPAVASFSFMLAPVSMLPGQVPGPVIPAPNLTAVATLQSVTTPLTVTLTPGQNSIVVGNGAPSDIILRGATTITAAGTEAVQSGRWIHGGGTRHFPSGTAADGSYIPQVHASDSGNGNQAPVAGPQANTAIKFKEAAAIIEALQLIPAGPVPSTGHQAYRRAGFSGVYTLFTEADGSISVFYSGGTHANNGRTLSGGPQWFYQGGWIADRGGLGVPAPSPVLSAVPQPAVLPAPVSSTVTPLTNTSGPTSFSYAAFSLNSIPERDRTAPNGAVSSTFVSMFAPDASVPGLRHPANNPWPLVAIELFQARNALERLHAPGGNGPAPNFQTDVLQRVQRLHFALLAARGNIPVEHHAAISQVASLYAQLQDLPNPASNTALLTAMRNTFGEAVYQTLATSGVRDAPYFYVNRSRGPFKSNFFRDHIQPVAEYIGLGGQNGVGSDFQFHFITSSSSRPPHETEIRLFEPRLQPDGTTSIRSTPHRNPTILGLLAAVQPAVDTSTTVGGQPRVPAPVNGPNGRNVLILGGLTCMRVILDAPQVRDWAARDPAYHSMAVLNSRNSLLGVEELFNALALSDPPSGANHYGFVRDSMRQLLTRMQPAIPALSIVGVGHLSRSRPTETELAVRRERVASINAGFSTDVETRATQTLGRCLRELLLAAEGGEANIGRFCNDETFRNSFLDQHFGPMSTYLQQNLHPNLDTPGHGVGDCLPRMKTWLTSNQNRLAALLAAPQPTPP